MHHQLQRLSSKFRWTQIVRNVAVTIRNFPILRSFAIRGGFAAICLLELSACAPMFQIHDTMIWPPGNETRAIPVDGVSWNCDPTEVITEAGAVTLRSDLLWIRGGSLEVAGGEFIQTRVALIALQKGLEARKDSLKDCSSGQVLIPRITAAVAELAPRSFAEDLNIRYGWNPHAPTYRTVDLLPGMMLRVEGGGTSRAGRELLAFNIDARLDFEVTSSFGQQSAAETPQSLNASTDLAFALSRLNMVVNPPPSPLMVKNITGIADLADPLGDANANAPTFRFWRLLYPATLAHNEALDTVDQTDKRIVLVGTRTTADMEILTAGIAAETSEANWGDLCDPAKAVVEKRTPKMAPSYSRCFNFRNRAIPIPMIRISVNGEGRWVPVGTVLGDILGQQEMPVPTSVVDFTPTTPALDRLVFTAERSRSTLQRLRLRRFFAGRYAALDKGIWTHEPSSSYSNLLRLPVVSGDQISW